jgi:hypothetical protein
MDTETTPLLELSYHDQISDSAFLTDIPQHLNGLNLQLHAKNYSVNNIFANIKALDIKVCPLESQK